MTSSEKIKHVKDNNPGLELGIVRIAFNENEVEKEVCDGKVNKTGGVPAVIVRKAYKHFKKGVPVLDNLNMTVNRGAIYSLLGNSGCGKSSLLNCIVGVRKLNRGSVYVFGAKPGLQGKTLGYMPQDTSLYNDFTIAETLSYFGVLYGVDKETIKLKTGLLKKLLHLPDTSQRVGRLSGGEQRRTSFAVALISNPELLVLDEPTVGVDPLLRERIWSHLVYLSIECSTTVLITTHYIDEARRSNIVGVMRHGRLLVEHDPNMLMDRFNTLSLESVVLKLCRLDPDPQDVPKGTIAGEELAVLQNDIGFPDDSDFLPPHDLEKPKGRTCDAALRVKSLITKNFIILSRNFLLSFFAVFLPAAVIYLMCIAFINDPKDLDFGVVNYEVSKVGYCSNHELRIDLRNLTGNCTVVDLSCKFIRNVPPDILKLVHFKNEADAATAVHNGKVWGYMLFDKDYSSSFLKRYTDGSNITESVLTASEIIVRMDHTSKFIAGKIKKCISDVFEAYAKNILRDCEIDERNGEYVLKYHTPVFGQDDMKYVNFLAPGITVAWLFFFPIIASSTRFINDKVEGTLERSLVAGTKTWEVFLAYSCTECIILLLQTMLVYFILTVAIGIELLGSHFLVMAMLFLSGFCGVWIGFLIGAMCREELEAALITYALIIPVLCLSGVFWPWEGMPPGLQYVSYALPCTFMGEAMRSIFSRGWPLSHPNVWMGFLTIMGWILIYFLLTVLVLKLKK